MTTKKTIVPANPGFFVMSLDWSTAEEVIEEMSPVIAFNLEEDEEGFITSYPISLDHGFSGLDYAILRPDGKVEMFEHCIFSSIADFKKNFLEEKKRKNNAA
jgi:hypothetical protein